MLENDSWFGCDSIKTQITEIHEALASPITPRLKEELIKIAAQAPVCTHTNRTPSTISAGNNTASTSQHPVLEVLLNLRTFADVRVSIKNGFWNWGDNEVVLAAESAVFADCICC